MFFDHSKEDDNDKNDHENLLRMVIRKKIA